MLLLGALLLGGAALARSAGAGRLRPPDEWLLFAPAPYPQGPSWDAEAQGCRDLFFPSEDGTRLHGWLCEAETPRAVLLHAHGNGGNLSHRAELARRLRGLGISTMIWDYRGYGRSEGRPSVPGILADARAARATLAAETGVPPEAQLLMGSSLGGAVALQLAADVPPRGLVLLSTFDSLRGVAREHYGRLAVLVPRAKLDSAAALARYSGPLLQGHGDDDRIVPYALGERLHRAAPGPARFVRFPGGGHNDPPPEAWWEALDDFVDGL